MYEIAKQTRDRKTVPRRAVVRAVDMETGFSRNWTSAGDVEVGMDAEERAAIVDEGFDPDDPAVVEAMARVRALLARIGCIGDRGQIVGKASNRTVAGRKEIGLKQANWVWGGRGSNPRPMDYESTALTD